MHHMLMCFDSDYNETVVKSLCKCISNKTLNVDNIFISLANANFVL